MTKFYSFNWFIVKGNNTNIKDINDCEPDPCIHGSCEDEVNLYTCACDSGYSGTDCAESNSKHYSFV